jgi:fatty-acyl-CoA synthase
MRRHALSGAGPAPRTFPHWLVATARYRSDLDAVSDPDARLTYGELIDRIHRAATHLTAAGLERAQPVCLALTPSADYSAWIFGALLAGGVPAPVNTRLAATEVAAYVDRIRPSLLVADAGHRHLFGQPAGPDRDGAPLLDVGPGGVELSQPIGETERAVDDLLKALREDDPAIIFPTGGTTGLPKGAYTDHEGLLLWSWSIAQGTRRHQHEVELYFSPFFHVSLMVGVFGTLFAGGSIYVEPAFDPGTSLQTIASRGITRLMGAPTMFTALADHPDATPEVLGLIRDITFGAAASTGAFVTKLLRDFPNARIVTGYGATELASGVTRVDHEDLKAGRLDGVGRPNAGCEIRVVDDQGVELAPGEVGNVLVRSPWQTLGYWNQPAETAATYRADGFIDLGDLGVFEPDGWLRIAGRSKEMIITGGENVFPIEVEQAISADPTVAEVVVFGVPDDHWGERVEAVITAAPGRTPQPDQLRGGLRERLGGYKVPKRIHVVDTIPLTANNKPDRIALSRRFREASGDRRLVKPEPTSQTGRSTSPAL